MLKNDSQIVLVASVVAANGITLSKIIIPPGEQSGFSQKLNRINYKLPHNSNVSLTPYRVIWQTTNDQHYAQHSNVGSGSFVQASQGDGPKSVGNKSNPVKTTPSSRLEQNRR